MNIVKMEDNCSEILYERVSLLMQIMNMPGVYIAGGALRTLFSGSESLDPEKTDIDLFFSSKNTLLKVKQILDKFYDKVFECPEGKLTSYRDEETGWKIQCITPRLYMDAIDVISEFDFTVCSLVTDGTTLWLGDTTLEDIGEKRLRWNKITYPASSLKRLMKYARKGYHMREEELREFVQKIWEHDDQISDVDLVYLD